MYCVRMCLSVTIVAMTHAEENNSKGKMAHFSKVNQVNCSHMLRTWYGMVIFI